MRIFLRNITIFITAYIFICTTFQLIIISFKKYNLNDECVYIWGDSQAVRAINLEKLSSLLDKNVISAAEHGGGVYNLLVFADRVPNNSNIILPISKPCQLRPKNWDNNASGWSFYALMELFKNDYSLYEIISISYINFLVEKKYFKKSQLYPNYEDIIIIEPLSRYQEIYEQVPEYLIHKQNIINNCIKKLYEKNCNVVFIEIPLHKKLNELESSSPVEPYLLSFNDKIINTYNIAVNDTISLGGSSQNIFYDLGHLNENGANLLTSYLADEIIKNKFNIFLTFKI